MVLLWVLICAAALIANLLICIICALKEDDDHPVAMIVIAFIGCLSFIKLVFSTDQTVWDPILKSIVNAIDSISPDSVALAIVSVIICGILVLLLLLGVPFLCFFMLPFWVGEFVEDRRPSQQSQFEPERHRYEETGHRDEQIIVAAKNDPGEDIVPAVRNSNHPKQSKKDRNDTDGSANDGIVCVRSKSINSER